MTSPIFFGGHKDLYIIDGFENLWTCFAEGGGEGVATGQHEGHFIAVDGVHLAVIDNDAHVAGIRSGERSLFHAAHHAFENRGHEAGVDGTAHDAVDEHQFSAPLEIHFFLTARRDTDLLIAEFEQGGFGHSFEVRFDDEVHFAELSRTARLFLVAIVARAGLVMVSR